MTAESSAEPLTAASETDKDVSGFFRMTDVMADMNHWVLPELGVRHDHMGWIKIMSAGCSDGRDTYSVAMLMEEFIQNRPEGSIHRYSMEACDNNSTMIELAREGTYGLDDAEAERVNGYRKYLQENTDHTVTVRDDIREQIEFTVRDIRTMYSREKYDIIFGTDRILQFEEAFQRMVIRELVSMVADNGFIYVNNIDERMLKDMGCMQISAGSHFYQKTVHRM